jgi:amino acid transporter
MSGNSGESVTANNGVRAESPHFRRVLSRSDLIIYGITILTPTAAYPVFGILQQISHGPAALSYLVAVVAMLLTAFSYGRMAAAFPSAGSTYTYARQSIHPYVGFVAGWAMILDYVLVPLLSAVYVSLTAVRLVPEVPYAVWAFLFAGGITAVNLFGIQVTARASRLMIIVMSASAALFVILAARTVIDSLGLAGLVQPRALLNSDTLAVGPLMTAAAVATLSYLGFDAVSTLAEDTRDPGKDIKFATVFVCLIQALFCFLISYLAALVWSPDRPFPNVETAILDISRIIGGAGMLGFTTFVLLVAAVASSITCQAGASRLLFGMGRDGILPRSVFGYLDPKRATPTRSIVVMGAISFVGALLISFQLVVELVNFGAFLGFVLVNLSVIGHYYVRLGERSGVAWLRNLLFPLAGAAVCVYIWMNLGAGAKLLGSVWTAVGVAYLAVLTRGFRTHIRDLEIS